MIAVVSAAVEAVAVDPHDRSARLPAGLQMGTLGLG